MRSGWGLVGSDGVFWHADNGTGKVSVYDGVDRTSDEYPTGHFSLGEGITGVAHMFDEGVVSHSFLVGKDCTPAELVFASEDGKLIAINDDTPPSGVVAATTQGANYKGVTKIQTGHGPALLAADFVGAKVDMFDSKWKPMTSPFVDPQMPAGWGPFNVLALGDRVYGHADRPRGSVGPRGRQR